MTELDLIKLDLHIHTLDDPKDKLDYSAHELLARARRLGFSALAITLHDEVFDRPKVFADAQRLGILLIPAAEMRIQGADIILLNVTPQDVEWLRDFDDIRELRKRRGETLFTIAPHPFYLLGGSIGKRLIDEIDCFDAIELCHFHKGFFNPNRRAMQVAEKYGKPSIATFDSDSGGDLFGTSGESRSPEQSGRDFSRDYQYLLFCVYRASAAQPFSPSPAVSIVNARGGWKPNVRR